MVIGMHGSILIMTMFCRRGTVFLELFPFGVPPENYTPYKTLAGLSGMGIVYRVMHFFVVDFFFLELG